MLIPSTMQARRTRAYSSTMYILHTFHRVASNSTEGGGWYGFAAPLPDAHPRLAGTLLLRPLHSAEGVGVGWDSHRVGAGSGTEARESAAASGRAYAEMEEAYRKERAAQGEDETVGHQARPGCRRTARAADRQRPLVVVCAEVVAY